MHKVVEGEPVAPPGVISVLGGKITGYRAIAEEVTNAVCRRLGAADRRSTTAETPLPGARPRPSTPDRAEKVPAFLYDLYGTRAADVIRLGQAEGGLDSRLSPNYPDIAAQVVFSVRFEHCVKLSDFLRRRTLLGASADQGMDAAPAVARIMAAELNWDDARMARELDDYRRDVASTLAFKNNT
jgi:glycerol-3-phosphate dehydrogenase